MAMSTTLNEVESASVAPGRRMQVLMVHEDEGALACIWHLTSLLQEQFPDIELQWHSCPASALSSPESEMAQVATEHGREADLLVFCSGLSVEVSPEIRRWTERWAASTPVGEAAIVQLIPCHASPSSQAAAYFRDLASQERITFLGVGRCCRTPVARGSRKT